MNDADKKEIEFLMPNGWSKESHPIDTFGKLHRKARRMMNISVHGCAAFLEVGEWVIHAIEADALIPNEELFQKMLVENMLMGELETLARKLLSISESDEATMRVLMASRISYLEEELEIEKQKAARWESAYEESAKRASDLERENNRLHGDKTFTDTTKRHMAELSKVEVSQDLNMSQTASSQLSFWGSKE